MTILSMTIISTVLGVSLFKDFKSEKEKADGGIEI
jgi:hypothetical protein